MLESLVCDEQTQIQINDKVIGLTDNNTPLETQNIGNFSYKYRDLITLVISQDWINCKVIEIFIRKFQNMQHTLPTKSLFYDLSLMELLKTNNMNDEIINNYYNNNNGENLIVDNSYDNIFVPIIVGSEKNHYALLVIKPKEKNIIYYDSLKVDRRNRVLSEECKLLKLWYNSHNQFHPINNFNTFIYDSPKQPNTNDCGCYCMLNIIYVSI